MRLILTLEYDGTPFRGWAVQPGLPTVEAALRQALAETFASVENLAVAGRTDTGVHALGQVASVDVEGGPPPERAAAALNSRLPDEITVLSSAEAPAGFHARHSARSRSYRYRLFTRSTPSPFELRRSWWHPAAARRGRAGGRRGRPRRRARLQGLHAGADTARGLRPRRRAGGMDPARRPPRLRDHGEQLPPPHGAQPRRHDGRGAGGDPRAARRPRPRRGGRHGAAVGPVPRAFQSPIKRNVAISPGASSRPPSTLSSSSSRMRRAGRLRLSASGWGFGLKTRRTRPLPSSACLRHEKTTSPPSSSGGSNGSPRRKSVR